MFDASQSREKSKPGARRNGPTRRSVLLGAIGAVAVGWPAHSAWVASAAKPIMRNAPVDRDVLAEWQAFKTRFVSADGRVIDTGNGNITHSEGQGYG